MHKRYFCQLAVVVTVLVMCTGTVHAQWTIGINGGYSQPMSDLSDRFDGNYNVQGEIIYQRSEQLGVELSVGYFTYETDPYDFTSPLTDREIVTDDLYLEYENVYVGLAARYHIMSGTGVRPYLIGGAALHRFTSIRGPYLINSFGEDGSISTTLTINRFGHSEYNLGLQGGVGMLFNAAGNVQFKVESRYHMVLGEVIATRSAGLKKVNPIQNIHLNAGIQFQL